MIVDRFNFYDVYGYLIPGLTLVMLLWTPFGIVSGKPPDDKIASLAVVLLLAYIVGHFLQSMATHAFSSRTDRDAGGQPAFPSVVLLNPSDKRIGPDLKQRLQSVVQSWFTINVAADKEADADIAQRRQDAYFICRPVVNAGKSYAEQFQGLYSMMRGLSLALFLAVPYLLGWAASAYHNPTVLLVAEVLVAVSAVASVFFALGAAGYVVQRLTRDAVAKANWERLALYVIGVLLLCVGYVAGSRTTVYYETAALLVLLCAVLFAMAMRFVIQYKVYTAEHAKSVWTQMAAQPVQRPPS